MPEMPATLTTLATLLCCYDLTPAVPTSPWHVPTSSATFQFESEL